MRDLDGFEWELPPGSFVQAMGCPMTGCGHSDGMLRVNYREYAVCTIHKVKWSMGINLNPTFVDESKDEYLDYREVEPVLSKDVNLLNEKGEVVCRLTKDQD